MDIWKYFGITHRDHVVCNPLSEAKLDEFIGLLDLGAEATVLDIACGKAELMCRIAERFPGTCVGVDISRYEVEAARKRVEGRGLADRVEVFEGHGAEYEVPPHSVDLALCIGADFVFGGYLSALKALIERTKPGGLIAVGAPFKLREPSPEYAADEPDLVPTLVTHARNLEIGIEVGLTPLYAVVSNQDDWDRYEGLQWLAAESYAREQPEDPDVPDLLRLCRRARDVFVQHGRDTLGWAIYLFRAAG